MVVNIRVRPYKLLINGRDYTEARDRLRIGFDSYAGRGAVSKSGTLVLKTVEGLPGTLDPRDNKDFMPGNFVELEWNQSNHALAGKLRILAVPSPATLPGNLSPLLPQNLQLILSVGCELVYKATVEPDNDFSDVTLGTETNGAAVATNLLRAAGVPNISLGGFANSFDYPIQKQGGGFIRQAADVTYSSGSNGAPTVLFCDETNTVKAKTINLDEPAQVILEVGQHMVDYQPESDPEIAPGTVQVTGTRKEVTEAPICSAFTNIESGVLVTNVVCNYEFWPFSTIRFGGRTVSIAGSKGQFQQTIRRELIGGSFIESQRIDFFQRYYDDDKLIAITRLGTTLKQNISSSATAPGEELQTVPYLIEEEFYGFSNDQIVAIQNYQEQPKVRVNPAESGDPFSLTQYEIRNQSWQQDGNYWSEVRTLRRARGLIDPNTEAEFIYDMAIDPRSTSIPSAAGKSQPPRVDIWQSLFKIDSYPVSEEAIFSQSEQRKQISLPYAFNVAQANNIGFAEGEIAWGRQHAYRLEGVDPDFFSGQTEPLFTIRVNEPVTGKSRIYLVDSIVWNHEKNQDFVDLTGIYLGDTDPQGSSNVRETNFPTPNTISPIGSDSPDVPVELAGRVSSVFGGVATIARYADGPTIRVN